VDAGRGHLGAAVPAGHRGDHVCSARWVYHSSSSPFPFPFPFILPCPVHSLPVPVHSHMRRRARASATRGRARGTQEYSQCSDLPPVDFLLLSLRAGHNLGNTISGNSGALMLQLLGVAPSGAVNESAQFERLWIASAISTVLPVRLVPPMMPAVRLDARRAAPRPRHKPKRSPDSTDPWTHDEPSREYHHCRPLRAARGAACGQPTTSAHACIYNRSGGVALAPRFERRGLQAFTLLLLPWMIPNASQKDTLLKDAQADDPHAGSIMRRLFG
jgi:hypothetical protein